jgi:hypothetical protein
MKYYNTIITIILLISLIMNFSLSSKIENVENQLFNVSSNQQQILGSVNGQEQHIRSVMNDIQKQQSWISEISMDVNAKDSEDGEMLAKFNWQIKEQFSDSKVLFHYTLGDQAPSTSIAPEDLQNGLYQVKIPISLHLEPQWEIFLREQDTETTNYEMDDKRKEEANKQTLKYFVSVTHNDAIKSSEIQTSYLGDLGIETFGVISVNLDILRDHSSVIVTTYKTGIIENIQLLTYNNESLVDEQPLKPEFDHYIIEDIQVKNTSRLVLKVTYKNGEAFEKEIYE